MLLVVWIFWGFIFAYSCACIAGSQGREQGPAAICGFLFGIFAVVGYLIAGKTVERQARDRMAVELEIKRLQLSIKE